MVLGADLIVRSVVGGAFMGLANLVPGISGGTMLLAVGIYPQFISGVAEVSTLRLRPAVLVMLASVGCAAVLAVAGGAGLIAAALDRSPWAMYSLFIGLTLGGVPMLWAAVRPLDATIVLNATTAIIMMALLAVIDPESFGHGGASGLSAVLLLVLAGAAGGAAMILPGVSGAYLLLILGQYRTIVDAVAAAADAGRSADIAAVLTTANVLAPVAVGVGVGIVGVSNIVKLLLARHERATLGFLLGLLLGAVIGLWPFGDATPTPWQASAALTLVATGFLCSWGISYLGQVKRNASTR
ncbi:MAG: DUF368 domain-containing protein [Acidobacteria bacterium]|nr:DUF368 domain-containing protein [Acidobacteriota bacterium]